MLRAQYELSAAEVEQPMQLARAFELALDGLQLREVHGAHAVGRLELQEDPVGLTPLP